MLTIWNYIFVLRYCFSQAIGGDVPRDLLDHFSDILQLIIDVSYKYLKETTLIISN